MFENRWKNKPDLSIKSNVVEKFPFFWQARSRFWQALSWSLLRPLSKVSTSSALGHGWNCHYWIWHARGYWYSTSHLPLVSKDHSPLGRHLDYDFWHLHFPFSGQIRPPKAWSLFLFSHYHNGNQFWFQLLCWPAQPEGVTQGIGVALGDARWQRNCVASKRN